MQGYRAERAAGSCPFIGEGAPKGFNIPVNGCGEAEERIEVVHAISLLEAEAVLGKSFLGKGVLCGYGGIGYGHDTQACKVSGEAGTASDSDESGQMMSNGTTRASLLRRLA